MEIGGLFIVLLQTLSLYRKGIPCTPSAWVGRCRGPFRWTFESAAADLRLPKAPVWLSQHPTRATRHSRVYSSTTTRVRTGCPSCVRLRTNSLESILSAESRRSIWTRFRGQGHSGVDGHCPSTSSNTSPAAPEGGRVPIAAASVIATSTV